MKDKHLWYIVGLSILVLVLLFIFGGVQHTTFVHTGLISGEGITNEVRIEDWNGIPVTIQSARFGEITNSGRGFFFCGSDDSDVILRNSYEIDNKLTLESNIGGDGRTCYGNYITAELTLPPGILKGNCYLRSDLLQSSGDSTALCRVSPFYEKGISASLLEGTVLNDWAVYSDEDFEYILEEETPLKIEIITNTGYSGGSVGMVEIEFVSADSEEALIDLITGDTIEEIEEKYEVDVSDLGCIQNIDCPSCSVGLPTCVETICICVKNEKPEGLRTTRIVLWIVMILIFIMVIFILYKLIKRSKYGK